MDLKASIPTFLSITLVVLAVIIILSLILLVKRLYGG